MAKCWCWRSALILLSNFFVISVLVSAERSITHEGSRSKKAEQLGSWFIEKASNILWMLEGSGYEHVWPKMKIGWRMIIGSIIGFLGAGCGSIGGVGGGGIYVPMLTLLIGFDQKSATAVSKCMIVGAAVSTVYYNLKLRHPTLDLPMIDYDLVLLVQPFLLLGISIGVTFNVIFPEWVVTILLILLLAVTSTRAFFLAIDKWKRETILLKEAAKLLESSDANRDIEYKPLPGGPSKSPSKETKKQEVSAIQNIRWKELGLLCFVWIVFLILQIAKNYTVTCSAAFWVLNLLQTPVSIGVFLYKAVSLCKGTRKISSIGDQATSWQVQRLLMFCACSALAGIIAGMLGLGGGSVMGPLFLELGIPPQVSSATATFAMTFSSSLSVVEYFLLKRFPVPYALYFTLVTVIGAFLGQHMINKLIAITGRASLIIFALVFTTFISCIILGAIGIRNMIEKLQHGEYMGFEDLCTYVA